MTLGPVVVGSDLPLAEAHRLMRERNIRHLPVVDAGCLVGLVSQRDLYLCGTLDGVDPASAPVREAMTPEPYAVDPDAAEKQVTGGGVTVRAGGAATCCPAIGVSLTTCAAVG